MSLLARLAVMVATALSLAGCWSGDVYLDAADAVAVLPDGRYRLGVGEPADELLTFRRQSDNSYQMTGPDRPWRVIIAPLASDRPKRFVVQGQLVFDGVPQPSALYMLLDRDGDVFRAYLLGCNGAAREAVERSGGSVGRDPNAAASCRFADRDTLFRMLAAARPENDGESLTLTRVPR